MDSESSPLSPQTSRVDSIALTLTACVISGLLIYQIYLRNIVFGSERGNWVYPYLSSATGIPFLIPLPAVLLPLGLIVLLGSRLFRSMEYSEREKRDLELKRKAESLRVRVLHAG
jgi:hypothetical protein